MSSIALSETSTLLGSSASQIQSQDGDIINADRPIQYDKFLKNVRTCKILMGFGLPGCLALETAHLLLSVLMLNMVASVFEKKIVVTGAIIDIFAITALVSACRLPPSMTCSNSSSGRVIRLSRGDIISPYCPTYHQVHSTSSIMHYIFFTASFDLHPCTPSNILYRDHTPNSIYYDPNRYLQLVPNRLFTGYSDQRRKYETWSKIAI